MEHLTDIQMMEFLGGHLPSDQRPRAEEHLATCEVCRSRHEQLTEVWNVLGEWEVSAGEHDLREQVLAAARAGGTLRLASTWRRWTLVTLKAAASVIIAVGIGYAAGRWNRASPLPPPPDDLEQRVASSLYLEAFESGTPAGLSELVLAADQPSLEEEQ